MSPTDTCPSCGAACEPELPGAKPSDRCKKCGSPVRPVLEQPVRLGKYLLLNRISAGGMGEVYYAKSEGVEGFERELAIKKMLPHLSADRNFAEMLVKEAKLTVLLNHPNIVQVYDLAKEGDEYFIVMEYVPGIPVDELIVHCRRNASKVPVAVAVHILALTLKGLAYAHSLRNTRGEPTQILHRDITPQNLLVTRQGWVKITDFGIAKACNEISSTGPGTIKGKFGYIAPELLRGEPGDQRIDVFSAGVVLWQLLTGKRLFKGQNDFDIARRVIEKDAPLVTSFRPDVNPDLASCIAKALARNPDERHRDADSFYDALMNAIWPRTEDDCARETKTFLATCESVFARKLTQKGSTSQEAVVHTEIPTKPSHTQPRRSHRRTILWMGGMAVLMIAAGLVGFKLRAARTRAKATEARPALSVPVAPAPPPPAPKVEPPASPPPVSDNPPVAAPSPGPAPKPAPKRPPKVLTAAEIQATVQRSHRAMSKCLRKLDHASTPGTIAAKLTVAANGRVGDVRLEPALASSPAHCLERTLKAMHFRPSPLPFQITIPLKIERVAP